MTTSISGVVRASACRLAPVSPTPRLDAEVLLGHVTGQSRAWLIARGDQPLGQAETAALARLVDRRAAGEPIAYLVGRRGFWTHDFDVSPEVLIPRPETEHLVEVALHHMAGGTPCRVADLGTGSGAIAVTLGLAHPASDVIGVDVSAPVLRIARRNAKRLGAANVRLVQGSWLDGFRPGPSIDLVVANPPYVAAGDPHLYRGDVRFEPRLALVAGPDGLDALRCIIRQARDHLRPSGHLILEHGFDQGGAVARLLQAAGYTDIEGHIDLGGHVRVTSARLERRYMT